MKNNALIKVSIILPCRNEEEGLSHSIKIIKKVVKENNISAEIIVSDSSTDSSPLIAKNENVILLKHDKEGYGNAYLEAINIAKGEYIFMADPDGSYDFNEIPKFIEELDKGHDLILGNRFGEKIDKHSMPFSHKYIGNPILSIMMRVLFANNIKDSQTGMRAIKKDQLKRLNLQTTGMEFASEMLIKAMKQNLDIKELPICYKKRIGKSKLRPISDAWRHIRFMLLYSPNFIFFIPGAIFLLLGIESFILLYFDPIILGRRFQYHPMFISSLFTIMGYQLLIFAIFAKTYAITHLKEKSYFMNFVYKHITLERASIIGIIFALLGTIIYANIFIGWINSNFGELNEIKNSIIALTLLILGLQTIFSSFMLSILGIKEKGER